MYGMIQTRYNAKVTEDDLPIFQKMFDFIFTEIIRAKYIPEPPILYWDESRKYIQIEGVHISSTSAPIMNLGYGGKHKSHQQTTSFIQNYDHKEIKGIDIHNEDLKGKMLCVNYWIPSGSGWNQTWYCILHSGYVYGVGVGVFMGDKGRQEINFSKRKEEGNLIKGLRVQYLSMYWYNPQGILINWPYDNPFRSVK